MAGGKRRLSARMGRRGARRRGPGPRALQHAPSLALLAALTLVLAACSDFSPEDLVAWRKSLTHEVSGAIPGTDQPYPNLATVPALPSEASSKDARTALQKRLEADNKATGYTPNKAVAPPIPSPPPALPPGFIAAEEPVQLSDAGTLVATPEGPRRVAIVLFAEGSSALDPRQVGKLQPVIDALNREGGTLELVGHASETSDGLDQTKVDNFDLSVARASAVAEALGRLGLKAGELSVTAKGDSAPVTAAGGVSGGAANRRVDIFLTE